MTTLGPAETCVHCGLPVRGGYHADGLAFCCYGCYLVRRITGDEADEGPATFILARLGVSAFLAMNIMMASLILYTDALQSIDSTVLLVLRYVLWVLATPVLILLATPFVSTAVKELSQRRLTMDSLVAMGALAAYGVSAVHVVQGVERPIYFDTATMLMVLVTVGKLLEAQAKTRTHQLLQGLLELGVAEATVVRDGVETRIPADEVRPGDVMRVRPGERIPADGVILRGRTTVEEAMFTGESAPRPCAPGDRVHGSSVNGDGFVEIRAEGVGRDSLLGQMARLVEEARQQRAPIERLADRLSAVFIPLVWAAALGALAYWSLVRGDAARGGLSALAVLVVACPCALGIATPLAVALGIGRAAQAGVLVRTPEALEALPSLTCIVLDKTGTLTRGRMELVGVQAEGCDAEEALGVMATLEQGSGHPLARALVEAARARGLRLGELVSLTQEPGEGVYGRVRMDGRTLEVRLGRPEWVGVDGWDAEGHPGALVAGAWQGVKALALLCDAPRPEAGTVVEALRGLGLGVAVLSGDRAAVTETVARGLGVERFAAEQSPSDKATFVQAMRESGDKVAMVGDGTNDAPALSAADVGIAMAGGTDLAREASDVTLLGDDLRRLPWLFGLARRTYRTIRQNLLWAFGYNLLCVTVAFLGYLHPLLAALLMLFSSLVVIGNSLRNSSRLGPETKAEPLCEVNDHDSLARFEPKMG